MNSRKQAVIYVLLCVICWALIPIIAKTGQSNLDNHQFLFWSSVTSIFTFAVIVLVKKKASSFIALTGRNWLNAISLGLLGTYLYYILLYFGYANAKGIEVLIIQYSWPIFVLVLSIIILKEKVNLKKILSIFFGFIGVFLVLSKGDFSNMHFENLTIDGIVLLAAFTAGLFSVMSKKTVIDPIVLVTIYFLVAVLASFLSMVYLSEFKLPTTGTIIPILINGILVNGLSYLFWIKALKKAEASYLAPFIFLTPIISAINLILIFDEEFKWVYVLGMAAVIVGGLINTKN